MWGPPCLDHACTGWARLSVLYFSLWGPWLTPRPVITRNRSQTQRRPAASLVRPCPAPSGPVRFSGCLLVPLMSVESEIAFYSAGAFSRSCTPVTLWFGKWRVPRARSRSAGAVLLLLLLLLLLFYYYYYYCCAPEFISDGGLEPSRPLAAGHVAIWRLVNAGRFIGFGASHG